MTLNIKYGITLTLVLLVFFSGFVFVKANPSYFVRANTSTCGSYTASTSVTYMTAGAATTTVTYDAGCAGSQGADSAVLLAQLTASSTGTTLNINYEYSQDAVDWYQSDISDQATSTANPIQSVSAAQSSTWIFASTTPGLGLALATGTFAQRQQKALLVRTPTRYVRAIFSLAPGSTAGAVWAEFVGKRQSP